MKLPQIGVYYEEFNFGRSSNGRTMDSGSIYLGSSPSLPAKLAANGKL